MLMRVSMFTWSVVTMRQLPIGVGVSLMTVRGEIVNELNAHLI